MTTLPLSGYRILSAEQYGAGPYGTMLLAQLGAEVIKIEPPKGGDSARAVGPHFLDENESIFFQTFNLNKRSITLDLRSAKGQEIFHQLVGQADVVANNMRGDLAQSFGLTYEALSKVNPSIVCAHLSAYGRDNERASWPGYDYLMQAEAGFLSVTGEPDAPPTRFGLSMVDFMAGTIMTIGLLAALANVGRGAPGCDVDVDLLNAALHQTSYPALWYMNEGDLTTRAPRSAHPSVTPSQMFRTADGWIFVMAQLPKFWTHLVERIGRGELLADPRFAGSADRLAHRDALTAALDETFTTRPTAHWLSLLQGHVPVAAVNNLDEALDSAFVRQTGMVDAVDHPARAGMKVLSCPIRISGSRPPLRAAPVLGADTDLLLAGLGHSEAEIASLRSQKVV